MAKKLRPRRGTITIHNEREKRPVPNVADAAIAAERFADGRLVPLLILDTTDRPDLEELVRIHEHLSPGDVECQWGALDPKEHISLVLLFKRPIESVAILDFDIVKQGILVDQILAAKLLYIQAGQVGDRFYKNPHAPKILVEIPDTGIRDYWDKIFHRHMTKHMRRSGLSRPQAKTGGQAGYSTDARV